MKIKLSAFHGVIRQFAPHSSLEGDQGATCRSIVAVGIAGLAAVKQLAKIRNQVVISREGDVVNVDVADPALFLAAIEEIEALPVEVPTTVGEFRMGEDKFYVTAGDNELGLPLEELACVECERVPAASDKVYFYPKSQDEWDPLCEAHAESRVDAYSQAAAATDEE